MSTGAIIALVIAIAAVVVFLVAVGGSKWGHKRGYSGWEGTPSLGAARVTSS